MIFSYGITRRNTYLTYSNKFVTSEKSFLHSAPHFVELSQNESQSDTTTYASGPMTDVNSEEIILESRSL
jgi:hypothetical protein